MCGLTLLFLCDAGTKLTTSPPSTAKPTYVLPSIVVAGQQGSFTVSIIVPLILVILLLILILVIIVVIFIVYKARK